MHKKSYMTLQHENPQSHEESVEALMIHIRKLCEAKQREHTHISDTNRASARNDVSRLGQKKQFLFVF